jgi:Mn-dependent DtxR family transcriptional regulator
MLEQLVREIRAGGTLEVHSLARRLNTSPQIVEAMLEHLQRSGLISAYVNCGDRCQGCGLKEACHTKPKNGVRLWQSRSES